MPARTTSATACPSDAGPAATRRCRHEALSKLSERRLAPPPSCPVATARCPAEAPRVVTKSAKLHIRTLAIASKALGSSPAGTTKGTSAAAAPRRPTAWRSTHFTPSISAPAVMSRTSSTDVVRQNRPQTRYVRSGGSSSADSRPRMPGIVIEGIASV